LSARLRNLQALRGAACLLVLFFHMAQGEVDTPFTHRLLTAFLYFGFAGVDLFFVLSGFVITWVHITVVGDRSRLAGYVGRRVWRIYPAYLVCWWLSVPVYLSLGWRWNLDWQWFAWFQLLLPTEHINEVLPQAWTLTYEVMFYTLFAAFFILPRRAFLPALGAWFFAVAAAIVAAVAGRPVPTLLMPNVPLARCAEWLSHPYVGEFLLGCFAAAAVRRGWVAGGWACLAGGVTAFAAGALSLFAGLGDCANCTSRFLQFGLPSALIVYGAASVERARGWALPRWLQVVGDASYAIYLIHLTVLKFLYLPLLSLRPDGSGHLLWIAALLAATLGAGFLVHVVVERPLLRLGRRPKSARPAQTQVAVAAEPGLRRAA